MININARLFIMKYLIIFIFFLSCNSEISYDFSEDKFRTNSINHGFVLKNPTKYNYAFYSFASTGVVITPIISNNEITIIDGKNNKIKEKDIFINNKEYFNNYRIDSINMNFYNSINFHKDIFWFATNREIKKNAVFLKSEQNIIFKRKIALLYNQIKATGSYFKLNKNINYFLQIEINFDSTKIKRYLTPLDLDSLRKNNIKIFHGKLRTKKIPLIYN